MEKLGPVRGALRGTRPEIIWTSVLNQIMYPSPHASLQLLLLHLLSLFGGARALILMFPP